MRHNTIRGGLVVLVLTLTGLVATNPVLADKDKATQDKGTKSKEKNNKTKPGLPGALTEEDTRR
jgi:hypothetical protein